MRTITRLLGCTVVSIGIGIGATALAKSHHPDHPAPPPPQRIGQREQEILRHAIERQYPGATYTLHKDRMEGGVRVFDADIQTRQGQTFATLTEFGDFLVSGVPQRIMSETGPVHRIIQELFHQPPSDVDEYLHTVYYVWVNSGPGHRHGMFQIELDATGRILDIKGSDQLSAENAADAHAEEAPHDIHELLEREVRRRQDDVRVTEVRQWSGGEGFYIVHFDRGHGVGFMIADAQGNVISTRFPIDAEQVPPPVMQSVENVFRRDQINHIERGTQRFYRFEEDTPGGTMVVRLAPNGDVLSVHMPGAAFEIDTPALRAGHHLH